MKLILILALAISSASFINASQDPNTKDQQTASAELVEVKVCPMTGEAVEGEGAGNLVHGKYKVYFCCAGCEKSFNKLSAEDKDKKVAAALEKQNAKK
jgi:hypothetical protein